MTSNLLRRAYLAASDRVGQRMHELAIETECLVSALSSTDDTQAQALWLKVTWLASECSRERRRYLRLWYAYDRRTRRVPCAA